MFAILLNTIQTHIQILTDAGFVLVSVWTNPLPPFSIISVSRPSKNFGPKSSKPRVSRWTLFATTMYYFWHFFQSDFRKWVISSFCASRQLRPFELQSSYCTYLLSGKVENIRWQFVGTIISGNSCRSHSLFFIFSDNSLLTDEYSDDSSMSGSTLHSTLWSVLLTTCSFPRQKLSRIN